MNAVTVEFTLGCSNTSVGVSIPGLCGLLSLQERSIAPSELSRHFFFLCPCVYVLHELCSRRWSGITGKTS